MSDTMGLWSVSAPTHLIAIRSESMTTPSENNSIIPIGLCQCGCGGITPIAKKTRSAIGHIKGQHVKFLPSHFAKYDRGLKWGYATNTETYHVWQSMIARCCHPQNGRRKWYGDRGITVCERWKNYANFFDDMGERPEGKSIDRINNDGNYEPGNCRWITQQENCNNTRANKHLTVNGETHTLAEWEHKLGITRGLISWRLKNGWSPEDCISAATGRKRADGK